MQRPWGRDKLGVSGELPEGRCDWGEGRIEDQRGKWGPMIVSGLVGSWYRRDFVSGVGEAFSGGILMCLCCGDNLISVLESCLSPWLLLRGKGYRELWADGGGHSALPDQLWWQPGLQG